MLIWTQYYTNSMLSIITTYKHSWTWSLSRSRSLSLSLSLKLEQKLVVCLNSDTPVSTISCSTLCTTMYLLA